MSESRPTSAQRMPAGLARYGSFDLSRSNSRSASPPSTAFASAEGSTSAKTLDACAVEERLLHTVTTRHMPSGLSDPESKRGGRTWTKSKETIVFPRVAKEAPPNHRRKSSHFDDTTESGGTSAADYDEWNDALADDADALNESAIMDEQGSKEARVPEAIYAKAGRSGLFFIYLSLYLITFISSLEANTTPTIEPYILSSFEAHSLLSSLAITVNIALSLGRPPMAKIFDIFGRQEGMSLAAALYGAGYIAASMSKNIVTFALSKTLAALGGAGLQLGVQVLVADTTSLTNRALFTSTLSVPWILTVWLGPPLGAYLLGFGIQGYHAAYVIFGIAVPAFCLPLIIGLYARYVQVQKSAQVAAHNKPSMVHLAPEPSTSSPIRRTSMRFSRSSVRAALAREESIAYIEPKSISVLAHQVWNELDVIGLSLLTAGGLCLLLPLSVAATMPESWSDPKVYICIALGLVCFRVFIKYESTVPTVPFIPERLFRESTIRAGCVLGFFHFVCQFTYESYFTSFLQVARFCSARDAQYINQSYLFSASIAAVFCGLLAKKSRRYKVWGLVGVSAHILGAILMVRFRKLNNAMWELVLSQIIGGVGGGFTTLSAQLGVQSVVSHEDVAMTTAVFLTVTQFGAAVGGSVAGAIWTTVLPRRLAHYLPAEEQPHIRNIMESIVVALSYPKGTPAREAINNAYVDTQWLLNMTALIALVPTLVSMISMRNVHLTNREAHAEGIVIMGRASVLIDDEETASETSSLLANETA